MDRIAPNPPAAGLLVAGFLAEAALLGVGPDSPYRSGGRIVLAALLGLAWFWSSASWALWHVARRFDAGRPLRRGALAALMTVGAVGYLTSWAFRLRAGRFVGVDTIGFALVNTRMLRLYLLQAEPEVLWAAAALTAVTAVLVPGLLRRTARARWAEPESPGWGAARRLAWCWATPLCLAGVLLVEADRSGTRRTLNRSLLFYRLNPLVSLVVGGVRSCFLEPIEPCLDPEDLRPIAAGEWWPGVPFPAGRRPPVILVAIESLRPDVVHLRHQGVEVTPHLNALARSGIRFTRAYAQSTHSDYSDVTVLPSLYPLRTRRHHYYRRDDPWPKACLYDLLKPLGYATAIVSSQNEQWGGMDRFLDGPNLDLFAHAGNAGAPTRVPDRDPGLAAEVRAGFLRAGKLDDARTVDVALAWAAAQVRRGAPFLLRLNFQDPHFPYEIGDGRPRPFRPCALDFPASFLDYPADKVDVVRNAYYNALHESDAQLGRLVAGLRRLGVLDESILAVYGENGEAFHENGGICHAGPPIEPMLRVACVLHAPRRAAPRVEDYPIELVDVAPTVLGLMGLPPHPSFQGSDVLAADRVPAADRLSFFHTENAVTRADAVLLGGRWKFHHDRDTGRERLFDVVADPGEARDLVAARPAVAALLRDLLASWRRRQLAYYHFPAYYRSYYPPRPPRLPSRAGRGDTAS